jgi:photosystem II stability/assembly factor-like uncharacterized protein
MLFLQLKSNHSERGGFFTILFLLVSALSGLVMLSQNFSIHSVMLNNENRYRGLSVVDDSVAWISGSKGSYCITKNGGKLWQCNTVKGYDSIDFRSVYAWSEDRAIIASAGQPCLLLLTNNGGKNWEIAYQNKNPNAFIDAIDFYNDSNGIALGDPIKNRMMFIQSSNGGKSWNEWNTEFCPLMDSGEAAFAASGTAMRFLSNGEIAFVSGGSKARLFIKNNNESVWRIFDSPFIQGETGQGIFSFIELDKQQLYLVGGDFKNENGIKNNAYSFINEKFISPVLSIRGYRECVEKADELTLLSVGPGGADLSLDKGKTWNKLSDEKNFNAVRKARNGSLILFSGKGKTGILKKN